MSLVEGTEPSLVSKTSASEKNWRRFFIVGGKNRGDNNGRDYSSDIDHSDRDNISRGGDDCRDNV